MKFFRPKVRADFNVGAGLPAFGLLGTSDQKGQHGRDEEGQHVRKTQVQASGAEVGEDRGQVSGLDPDERGVRLQRRDPRPAEKLRENRLGIHRGEDWGRRGWDQLRRPSTKH